MNVAIYTWNAAETLERGVPLPISGWLTAVGTSDSRPATAPDICAVGFQESVSLPLALAGSTPSFVDIYEHFIQRELEKNAQQSGSKTSYFLLSKHSIGALALFIFAKDSLKEDIEDITTADVGCGPLYMSNKGAVGVRFRLKQSQAIMTFVTAHLAPHDYNVSRRNQDWRSVIERLIFYQDEGSEQYQIYDTDYLFVFGDLNYRTSKIEPKALNEDTFLELLEKKQYSSILAHDQLGMESIHKRTLHHLEEQEIDFPPSYKYEKGTNELVSFTKRTPSYCDRILHLPSEGQRALVYTSIHSPNPSDHKPVIAHYHIEPVKQGHSDWSSPYGIDDSGLWNRTGGLIMDRLVGTAWRIATLAGFGNDKLGLFIVLFGLIIALLYREYDLNLADTVNKLEYMYKRLQ